MKYFLFSTKSNPGLAKELIKKAPCLAGGKCLISHYKDGEILVHIDEDIKGKKVFVLGSTFPPAKNMLELIILINTLKENGAKKIIVLMPYFGYGKQDKMKYSGDAMSAKLMANIIDLAGAGEIIALDLHSEMAGSYFRKLKHLSAVNTLAVYFKVIGLKKIIIISPDKGGVERAKRFASNLKIKKIVVIEKYRPKVDENRVTKIKGRVKGRNIIIVDDMTQTGGTLIESAKALKKMGAGDIYVALTHLVPTGPAVKNLEKDKNIKKIVVTNSIRLPASIYKSKKFEIISCVDVFANNLK
ncbi:MAG: ribose-phosphate pyrophosphokinase [Patescibacteria group bacterium]